MALVPLAGCSPSSTYRSMGADQGPGCTDCDADGWTVAQGDCNDHDPTIHPGAKELCDHKDHNCNGAFDDICDDDKDGYSICPSNLFQNCSTLTSLFPGGDCNDADPLVNPGAFEIAGNNIDDNCNGMTDEVTPPCDTNPDPNNPVSYANAFELCDPWLQSATVNKMADLKAKAIVPDFGSCVKPKGGSSMILLSNGIAADENDIGYMPPNPGTIFNNVEANPLVLKSKNICTAATITAPNTVNDLVMLTMKVKVPTNAFSFSFNLDFYSAEYPRFVGNVYNDEFMAILDSKKFQGNISFDANGDPITVDGAFFSVCKDEPTCTMVPACNCTRNCPAFCGHHCPQGPSCLNGTGYEIADPALNGEPSGGGTGWLTTTAPVTPGETITLTFVVFDAGDHLFDSAVVLDNFKWGVLQMGGPITVPIQ